MHFPKKNTVIFTFALAAMTEQVTFTSVNMFFTHRRQIERVACNTKVIFTKSSLLLCVDGASLTVMFILFSVRSG